MDSPEKLCRAIIVFPWLPLVGIDLVDDSSEWKFETNYELCSFTWGER